MAKSTAGRNSKPKKSKTVVTAEDPSESHEPLLLPPPQPQPQPQPASLILTSEKRRGVFECDCCGVDVSQAPRIQCAVCVDYDVCLDCFAKDDAVSTHHPQHKPNLHGYRVADSTRFPLFPAFRGVAPASSLPVAASNKNSKKGGDLILSPKSKPVNDPNPRSDSTINVLSDLPPDEFGKEHTISDSLIGRTHTTGDLHLEESDCMDNIPKVKPLETTGAFNLDHIHTEEKAQDSLNSSLNSKEESTIFLEWMSTEDPKNIWTVEEDLRLLDAIQTLGVGNWEDISEVVCNGFYSNPPLLMHALNLPSTVSTNTNVYVKTAKKCMERYLDDYLGRYGHIVPPFVFEMILDEKDTEWGGPIIPSPTDISVDHRPSHSEQEQVTSDGQAIITESDTNLDSNDTTTMDTTIMPCLTRKRQRKEMVSRLEATVDQDQVIVSSGKNPKRLKQSVKTKQDDSRSSKCPIVNSLPVKVPLKKYRIVPSSSIPDYDSIWPNKYIPSILGVAMDDEVGRDIAYRAEQAFVKQISSCSTQEEAKQVRTLWENTRLNKPDGPRVLPIRLDDHKSLPGADLVGYMPRRVDFDVEWDNDQELLLAEMEFSPSDSPEDKELKIQVIEIYNHRLDEREKRKKFLVERNLIDYKKNQMMLQQLPSDERDLVNRMRMFARFHSAQEHETFIRNLLEAKRLRKDIAKLQMYRRLGLRSMSEVERWELDMKHGELLSGIASAEAKSNSRTNSISHMGSNLTDCTMDASDKKYAKMDSSLSASSKISDDYWKSSRSYRTTGRGERALRLESDIIDGCESAGSSDRASSFVSNGVEIDGNRDGTQSNRTTDDIKIRDEPMDDVAAIGSHDIDTSNRNLAGPGILCSQECGNNPIETTDNTGNFADATIDLLSPKEIDLCRRLSIAPSHYIQVKTILIRQSFDDGFNIQNTDDRILKIDVSKHRNVIDFCLRNGWIGKF